MIDIEILNIDEEIVTCNFTSKYFPCASPCSKITKKKMKIRLSTVAILRCRFIAAPAIDTTSFSAHVLRRFSFSGRILACRSMQE